MIYKFVFVNNNRFVEIYFISEEDAIAHAKRLATVNGDIAIYISDKQLAFITAA